MEAMLGLRVSDVVFLSALFTFGATLLCWAIAMAG